MVVQNYYQMQTLFDLCVRKISHEYYLFFEDLDFLPIRAKVKILDILCKRGKANKKSIKDLANYQVMKLDLYGNDVTDDILQYTTVCKNLTSLSIATVRNYPVNVTDKGLMYILPNFKHLKVVHLNNCRYITDESIISLSENCANLEIINLSGCYMIGDKSVISLVESCPNIKALTVARTRVSDAGIYSLSQSTCIHTLKELQLDGCQNITDNSIEFLSRFCTHLSILTFSNCRQITDQSRCILANFMERSGSQMKQMFWSISV